MVDRIMEGQLKLTLDFNGKIDVVYNNNLNSKLEPMNVRLKKVKVQVVQTGEAVKMKETFIKGKGDESLKHHVNAIIEDLWKIIKEEKLQEGDFEVESCMSFGSSHWCQPTPSYEHRPIE